MSFILRNAVPEMEGVGGILTIDLSALVQNYYALVRTAEPAITGAVVKANAYGLGVEEVSCALYQAGCRHFFVALLGEAIELRRYLPEAVDIYVLSGIFSGEEDLCVKFNITPVLNSLEQIDNWVSAAHLSGRRLPSVLQIDSGMARLGLDEREIETMLADRRKFEALDLRLIMSHFACADEPEHTHNSYQLKAFNTFCSNFPGVPQSISNSAGIFLQDKADLDLVRPGIALYGGAANALDGCLMQQVVQLKVRIIQVRTVSAGTMVGYGGTYVAPTQMRLATLAAGYADGVMRSLSNKGLAFFDDTQLPFLGRVSMDSVVVDVSRCEKSPRPGDFVELVGPHQSLEQISHAAGTISYEFLTQLGSRYQRIYLPAT